MVKENAWKVKVSCVGIRQDTDITLIEGAAKAGNGSWNRSSGMMKLLSLLYPLENKHYRLVFLM